ncbi:hypothetical protein VNO77_43590 [Canavalia gladiata]|uniref:Uncharacterized protein n=1 Tax=Canavalia gladiata TaxID=3824 RepID=A0AAN9JWI1_CANGL
MVELKFSNTIRVTKKRSDFMSPKFFSLNSLLERRKAQDSTDELAIVKAAAWAWYQHGSGSEGKAKSEVDVPRTQHVARPSRYKLEAMRMAKEGSSIHTNKSLLDAYEVQSISRQLDRLIESSSHNKLGDGNNFANKNAGVDNSNRRMKNKKRIGKGFWPRHVIVCGRGNDVVDGTALLAKHVPVPKAHNCNIFSHLYLTVLQVSEFNADCRRDGKRLDNIEKVEMGKTIFGVDLKKSDVTESTALKER